MLVLVLFLCCIILSVELVTMVFSERKNTLLPMAEEVLQRIARCLSKRQSHQKCHIQVFKHYEKLGTIACKPGSDKASKMMTNAK